jgi:hypothetical protein
VTMPAAILADLDGEVRVTIAATDADRNPS